MKIMGSAVVLLLAGCMTTWDGTLPARDYEIGFFDSNGNPITGVKTDCRGNDIWPSNEISEEINKSNSASKNDGVLKLSHNGYEVGGSHYEFLGFTWGAGEPSKVSCKFVYKGKVITEGELSQYNTPKKIIVEFQ